MNFTPIPPTATEAISLNGTNTVVNSHEGGFRYGAIVNGNLTVNGTGTLNVSAMDDVVKRVERVFGNKAYVDSVSKSGKNWLDMPVEAVLKKDLEFIKSL